MKLAICNEIFQGWRIDAVLSIARAWATRALKSRPLPWGTQPGKSRRMRGGKSARARRGTASPFAACIGCWRKPRAFALLMPMRRCARGRRPIFASWLIVARTSAAKRWCSARPNSAMFRPDWRRNGRGISPRKLWPGRPTRRERGAIICIEPLAPAETNFINTAAEAIRFARQFGSPAMKIALDVKAMCAEPKPIPRIIRQSWPHFAHFHANDKNLKGPGFGEIDFHPIAAALKETGYEGYVSVEVFRFEEGPETIARRSLEYLRRVFR